MMKDMGYGKGYLYPHDDPERIVDQEYLPEAIRGKKFYIPTEEGMERIIRARLQKWQAIRNKKRLRRGP